MRDQTTGKLTTVLLDVEGVSFKNQAPPTLRMVDPYTGRTLVRQGVAADGNPHYAEYQRDEAPQENMRYGMTEPKHGLYDDAQVCANVTCAHHVESS